jgi:thioredoxin reductase (NADPH)
MQPDVSATATLRQAQLFPVLTDAEVARLRRFGTIETWPAGTRLFTAGEPRPGMFVLLRGRVAVTRKEGPDQVVPIVEQGPGEFVAETGQLSGRPSLVDGTALTDLQAILIPSDQLRALLISEAELGERIMRALILRRVVLIETGSGPALVGPPGDPELLRLQGFLTRNGHPYRALDPATDSHAAELVEHEHATARDMPLVVCLDGRVLHNPTEAQLARCLGLQPELDSEHIYDVAVVGAGPAGLATAVYAASEGLSVLVLDARAPGGQAGASSRIENYLGFPTGISGQALAGRAFVQAQKFGATVAVATSVARLDCTPRPLTLTMTDGRQVRSRSAVVASGAAYRRLSLPDADRFDGRGVHYWASPLEAKLCRAEDVVLVGGGNSAGQAVVFLACHARHVHMLIRGASLASSMSRYLIDRIESLPNVTLHVQTEITALEGGEHGLEAVHCTTRGKPEQRHAVRRLFLFIGADPNAAWLQGCGAACDDKGFLLTGQAGASHALETSVSGVFAIGDVRAGSVKRVAAAVGEGAAAVAQVHAYLAAEGSGH